MTCFSWRERQGCKPYLATHASVKYRTSTSLFRGFKPSTSSSSAAGS